MLAAQAHRGPEGSGIERLGAAVLGCCRLAFVDVGTSRQPYCSPDGRVLVVFNGEIYNHQELRSSLRAGDAPFTTPGEVAVLAALYLRYGPAMANRLNGMFAIALFDAYRDETILIRDRFGKKPLYYFVRNGQVVLASELRALQACQETPTELDAEALGLYLTFNAVPSPFSLIQNVHQVPPGSVVRIREGVAHIESYWDLKLEPRHRPGVEAFAQVHRLLQNAVERRIPREVPFGVFLSGGLDSAVVAAIAARFADLPLRTFSVGFSDQPSYDESKYARAVSDALGTQHTVLTLSLQDLATASVRCLTRVDQPVADQSLVPTEALAGTARAEVKAVLTGDGADELLMGYRLFQAMVALRTVQKILPGQMLARVLARIGEGKPSDRNLHYTHVARLLARTLGEPPERQYYAAGAAVPPADWSSIFTPAILAELRTLNPFSQLDELIAQHAHADAAERLQLGMVCYFLRDSILTKLDRATMLASLEARSPFLDHELVDSLLQLPAHWKLHRLTTKYILKRVAELYLPKPFIYRQKQGFRAPTAALLRGPLLEFTRDHLAASQLRVAGIFQPDRVERLLDEHLHCVHDHHRTLWAILCFQIWLGSQKSTPAEPLSFSAVPEFEA